MAFGQTTTGFKVGINSSPLNTGMSSGFSSGFTNNTLIGGGKNNKKDDNTYNPRYPGFDENDYKRLEQIVRSQGVTGSNFDQLMDEAYQYYYPQVLNKHKLAERGQELNNAVYENGDAILNGEGNANEKIKLTQLSQKAKEKFGIPYDFPDEELLKMMEEGTDNRNKLLYDYVYKGSDELLYQTGIYDQKQRGGIKGLINPASEGGILPEKSSEWLNPLGGATETLDNAANKFADKFLDFGNMAATATTENLQEKLDNMTQKEVEAYRKQYEKLLKEKDRRVGTVQGNNLVQQLWNGIKGNISYDYDDEDFLKWVISQKANLWESLSGADEILQGETNPNVIQFFGNIPASALKTFTSTVRGMTNPYDTMKGLYKLAATEEGHEALKQRYGSWDALANAMNNDPVGVADDMLAVAELGANIVGGGLKFTGKVTGNTNLTNLGTNIQGSIGSVNDIAAQKTVGSIYGGLDNISKWVDGKSSTLGTVTQGLNRYIQDTSSLNKLLENGKADLEALEKSDFGQSVKNAYDEMVNKVVGIDEADREFIRENKELVNENLNNKRNVETIYDDVKEKIKGKKSEAGKMRQEYDTIRESGDMTNTKGMKQEMQEKFASQKIKIKKNGQLEFDSLSKYNASQQKAIQDAWQVILDAEKRGNLDASTVLDLRQKLDDKINRSGKPSESRNMSSVDKATESLIKDMRTTLDTRAKNSIKGLSELDAKYSKAIAELQQIEKDRFDSNGNFKDNARSKLRNMTKAGNEERLARLEEIAPGISRDLKALDVALTIEKASKQGVGQYAKGNFLGTLGGGAGVGTLLGNPVAGAGVGVLLWVLASPKNYVKLIEVYPDIAQKIAAGQELLPSDMNKLTSLASRIQDGTEE